MSRLKWLVCLYPIFLFTCFDPKYSEGIECSEVNTCPPGLTCGSDHRCWQMEPGARCGDGIVVTGEVCDDGNETSGDGCSADCRSDETCGNGVIDSHKGEVCDDGNTVDTDACLTSCVAARCGDGVVHAGVEECDDGNDSNADACTNVCEVANCSDGFQNADEIDVDCGGHCGPRSCDLGQACGMPADCASDLCNMGVCVAALQTSCLAILQAGEATGDGIYTIDPDGPGGEAAFEVFCDMTSSGGGWTRCLEFTNTENEDVNNNDWFDTCVAFTMAPWTDNELFIKLENEAGSTVYEATGTRDREWTPAQLTSTAAVTVQYDLNTHQPVILSNADRLIIPGKNSNSSGCHGSLGNGYGLLVYPPDVTSPAQANLMAMPYRHQVGTNSPRGIGLGNAQWFVNNEITFDGTTSWDTCGYPPGYLGTLDFYVR